MRGPSARHALTRQRPLVDAWLEGFLGDRRDAADEHVTGADSDPFEAEQFFGADNWQVWRPDARASTARFLEQDHPNLAARYLRADTVERLLVDDDELIIAPADRGALEADLRSYGRRVQPWPSSTSAPTPSNSPLSATCCRGERRALGAAVVSAV